MRQHLRLTEVVQTESDQRITLQPVRLDGIVAGFAEAERAAVDPLQGAVDFGDEVVEVGSGNGVGSRLKSSAPFQKLRAEPVIRRGESCGRIHFGSPPDPSYCPASETRRPTAPTAGCLTVLGARRTGSISRGANPGTDSQFPANCAGNLVSVPGLRRILLDRRAAQMRQQLISEDDGRQQGRNRPS